MFILLMYVALIGDRFVCFCHRFPPSFSSASDSDADDDIGDLTLVTIFDSECWLAKANQNGHQHLIVVTNTFLLQHPSFTSM